ncbi:ATP-binding protein [Kitasatospora sp. NPDC059795]|uniref:ATP-binding protein n=1 Tax=Kitasatospora sp. NPDC059795 TaxID=3346949 RepID=UPI0036535A98
MDATVHGLRVWEQALAATPASVRLARHGVAEALQAWGWHPDRAADVVLICSELVTNAIRHACRIGESVPVRLEEADGGCRIEVRDGRSDVTPVLRPSGIRGDGQGLRLVAELAVGWGVGTGRGTKTVWARVAAGSSVSEALSQDGSAVAWSR